MPIQHLRVTRDGPMLRVVIHRPDKHNALSLDVLTELAETFAQQALDPELKLAVISGAGERSFAAGGDLRQLAEVRTEPQTRDMVRIARAALDGIRDFPVPVVAALNGDALGGGAELAVACDFIVARRGARIGFIQGRLNLSTAWNGGIRLFERVGSRAGLRLLCRTEMTGGDAALAMGLIDAIADDGQSLDEALEAFCAPILRQTRNVLTAFKRLARAHADGANRAELDRIEIEDFVANWIHEDHWRVAAGVLDDRKSV
ncbi:enoyl-CoA hydratase/isomerase family protein [Rhodocyclaceae bacterium SMB388]